MLAMASVSTPAAAALDGQSIAYPALVRLHKLLQEYEKTARPGRRGRKDTAAPPRGIQTLTGDPGHLAVATDCSPSSPAARRSSPPASTPVIAKASNITTVRIANGGPSSSAP